MSLTTLEIHSATWELTMVCVKVIECVSWRFIEGRPARVDTWN